MTVSDGLTISDSLSL